MGADEASTSWQFFKMAVIHNSIVKEQVSLLLGMLLMQCAEFGEGGGVVGG